MDIQLTIMQQNKADHIEQTVHRERGRLLSFIRQFVSRKEEAEDIVQEVLYQFVISYDDIRSMDQVSSWLFRVARNKVTDAFRKRKPEPFSDLGRQDSDKDILMLEDILPDIRELPDEGLLRELIWSTIEKTLENIDRKQREVFVMHEFEQKSFKEIQEYTGEGINTLISRKRYAILALRTALFELYNELINHD